VRVSADLKDLRTKVTTRTDAVLEAINRATGRDKCELAREVLDKWAAEQIHAASLIDHMLKAEGEPGIAAGIVGIRREARG